MKSKMDINENNHVISGFFYFFGLIDNPSKEHLNDVLKENPATKIKSDINKVNHSLKESYSKIKKKVLVDELY